MAIARQFVAYYRVSTDRQGRSGLGLEAQREAVLRHLAGVGGKLEGEFIEVESGKRNDRPQLAAAISAAKKAKGTLIIAKLDRLARNVHFVSGLMESGVDFVAADNPHANKLMVHLLAAFAEHEREQISQRTKEALAAAKARGIKLGRNGAERLAPAYRAAAVERARDLAPILAEFQSAGLSARQIAAELTARGIPKALAAAKARGIKLGRNGAERLAPAYRAAAVGKRFWRLPATPQGALCVAGAAGVEHIGQSAVREAHAEHVGPLLVGYDPGRQIDGQAKIAFLRGLAMPL
jgi:DNA invertase Pin-like site-specific DNA recombinase